MGQFFSQSIFLFFQPFRRFQTLRSVHAIGKPFGMCLLIVGINGLLALVFWSRISTGISAVVPSISPMISSASNVSIGHFIYGAALGIVFLFLLFLLLWSLTATVIHSIAILHGGRGEWSVFAIALLYYFFSLLLIQFFFGIFFLAFGTVGSFVFSLIFIIEPLFFVWSVIMLIAGVRAHYGLGWMKSFSSVVIPPFALIFGFFSTSFLLPVQVREQAIAPRSEQTQSPQPQNQNINTTDSNQNFTKPNNGQIGFYKTDPQLIAKYTTERQDEISKITETGFDGERKKDLIEMKYDLLVYFSVYQSFPKAPIPVKLDGTNDALNAAFAEFYGISRNFLDPQHPSYYYMYQSDGSSFTLSAFNSIEKKQMIVTND